MPHSFSQLPQESGLQSPGGASQCRPRRSSTLSHASAASASGTPKRRCTDQPRQPSPAVVQPAKKRRKASPPPFKAEDYDVSGKKGEELKETLKKIYQLPDEHAWELRDSVIIEAARSRWVSQYYEHFNISISKQLDGQKKVIWFVFRCKYQDKRHAPYERERTSTTDGTSNLKRGVLSCDKRSPNRQLSTHPVSTGFSTYSEVHHRALIAIRCAASKQSFQSIVDPLYIAECRLLRPGINIPSPQTVQRDVEALYEDLAHRLKQHFKVRNRHLHAALDGWSTPLFSSFLGIVIIWEEDGNIHRSLLELVELDAGHTGAYLARKMADCLKRYGLDKYLHLVAMDNALNCDTAAISIPAHIPTFRGSSDRLRCFTHCIQLISHMIISFFNKQYERKKTDKIHTLVVDANNTRGSVAGECNGGKSDDLGKDADNVNLGDVLMYEQMERDMAMQAVADAGQSVHDSDVVSKIGQRAIAEMATHGVILTDSEMHTAQQIIPKVAGLSIKTQDSSVIRDTFRNLIADHPPDYGQFKTLARRNATRWDSEFSCLNSYLALQKVVRTLTAHNDLNLSRFRLTEHQWTIAKDLCGMLSCISAVTKLFQNVDVPLIIDVIPALEDLQAQLKAMSEDGTLPTVCRVAAHAGLLMSQKYYSLLGACDAYVIAIVMCPDRKLEWFRAQEWTPDAIEAVRNKVVHCFNESFERYSTSSSSNLMRNSFSTTSINSTCWQKRSPIVQPSGPDDIITYLNSSTHSLACGETVLKYWDRLLPVTPALAHMGLAYTSAPATCVDVERAFSEGRNQVNWNRKSTSSQALRARTSVGAWSRAPWFDFETAVAVLEKHTQAPVLQSS